MANRPCPTRQGQQRNTGCFSVCCRQAGNSGASAEALPRETDTAVTATLEQRRHLQPLSFQTLSYNFFLVVCGGGGGGGAGVGCGLFKCGGCVGEVLGVGCLNVVVVLGRCWVRAV